MADRDRDDPTDQDRPDVPQDVPLGAPYLVAWKDPNTGAIHFNTNIAQRDQIYGLLGVVEERVAVNAVMQEIGQAQAQGRIHRPPPNLRLD